MTLDQYPNELLNIDFLSSTLYNFLHSNSSSIRSLPDIDYKNIQIEDFKLDLPLSQQSTVLDNIFDAEITKLFEHNSSIIMKRHKNGNSLDVKITPYYDNRMTISSHENANALITWILSSLVIKGITKGILLNIMTVDIRVSKLKDYIKNIPFLSSLQSKPDNSYVKFEISEHYFKKCNVRIEIDRLTDVQISSIIIQVFMILLRIQDVYPGFRHNSLNLKSVFYYCKKSQNITEIYDGKSFTYDDHGIQVKITNFDNSIISGITDNLSLDSEKKFDDTYDIITFLKALDSGNYYNTKTLINKLKNSSMTNVIMSEYFNMGENTEMTGGKGRSGKKHKITGVRYLRNEADSHQDNYDNNDYSFRDTSPGFIDDSPLKSDNFGDSMPEYNQGFCSQMSQGPMRDPMIYDDYKMYGNQMPMPPNNYMSQGPMNMSMGMGQGPMNMSYGMQDPTMLNYGNSSDINIGDLDGIPTMSGGNADADIIDFTESEVMVGGGDDIIDFTETEFMVGGGGDAEFIDLTETGTETNDFFFHR